MAEDGIDVQYRNPSTDVTFGFGLPLPEAIATQVRTGKLVPCDPDGPQLPPPAQEADLTGGGTGEDEAVLHPCGNCGEVAARDDSGEYLDHCAKHKPKPAAGKGK